MLRVIDDHAKALHQSRRDIETLTSALQEAIDAVPSTWNGGHISDPNLIAISACISGLAKLCKEATATIAAIRRWNKG